MRKNLYQHGSSAVHVVLPLGAGGSSATTAKGALENLGGISPGSPVVVNLDENAKVRSSVFGSAIFPSVTIDGILDVASNTNYTYKITNYDKDFQYNLSQVVGSTLVSFTKDTIVIKTNNNIQATDQVGFTINNKIIRLAPIPNGVNRPDILTPINNAIDLDEILELRCTTFSYVGDPDTHKNTTWEIASNSTFTNIVHRHTNTAFTYNIVDRSILSWSQVYYLRVKQTGNSDRYSDWSDAVKFTIMNTPALPVFSIESAAALQTVDVAEGETTNTNVILTVKRTGTYLGIPSIATWTITLETASADDVQTVLTGTINFAAGVTSNTVSIAVTGDYKVEGNETFKVGITSDANSSISTTKSFVTVTITDNDIVPVVNVSTTVATIAEPSAGEVDVVFNINRTGNTKIASSVGWSIITTGTGYVSAADFGSSTQTFNGSSSFLVDELQKSITFKLKADTVSESTEIISFTIANPVGCSLGTVTNKEITVTKPLPVVAVASVDQTSVPEPTTGTKNVTFGISKTGNEVCSVDWFLTSGTGYIDISDLASGQVVSGTISFDVTDTSKNVTISIKPDSDYSEGSENIKLELRTPVDCTIDPTKTSKTCSVLDAAMPVIGISSSVITVQEPTGTNTSTITFTATRTGNGACSVNYSETGTATEADFSTYSASGTLTFLDTDTTKTVVYTLKSDNVSDSNETLEVTLSSPTDCTISSTAGKATVNITEAPLPVISIVADKTTIIEPTGSSTIVITFTATKTSGGVCSVNYFQSGTATEADFSTYISNGTLTFLDTDTTKTVVYTLKSDTDADSNETLEVTLSSPTNCTISTTAGKATVNITETAQPELRIDCNKTTVAEPGSLTGSVTITFTITKTGAGACSCYYSETGTVEQADFSTYSLNGIINFLSADTTKTLTYVLKNENTLEGQETLEIWLNTPTGCTIDSTAASSLVYITNTTILPVLTLTANKTEVNEPSDTQNPVDIIFTITKTGSGACSCNYITTDSSSTSDDFSTYSETGSLIFGTDDVSKTVKYSVKSDYASEFTETLIMQLTDPEDCEFQGLGSYLSVSIKDTAPGLPVASVVVDRSNIVEPATGLIDVIFTVSITRSATCNCHVSALTNMSYLDFGGSDPSYSNLLNNTEIAYFTEGGATTKVYKYGIKADTLNEEREYLQLDLSGPVGCTISTTKKEAIAYVDDPTGGVLPVLSISANVADVTEPSDTATTDIIFTITKTGAGTCGCSWNTGGSLSSIDFGTGTGYNGGLGTGIVSFSATETTKTFKYMLISDSLAEVKESLSMMIQSPNGCTIGTNEAIVYVTDGVAGVLPVLSITSSITSITEPATGTANIAFTITKTGSGACSCYYSQTGTVVAADFTTGGYTNDQFISFTASETSKTVTYVLKSDTLDEDTETLTVALNTPSGCTLHATKYRHEVSIADGTPTALPVLSISSSTTSITEPATGTTSISFTVTKTGSGACSCYYSQSGTVVAADFTTGGYTDDLLLDFTATETSKTVTYVLKSDTLDEDTETLTVALNTPSGCTLHATKYRHEVSIADGTPTALPVVSISTSLTTITEPATGTTNISFTITKTGAGACKVKYTQLGSAKIDDFSTYFTNGVINFLATETSKTLTYVLKSDTLDEDTETLSIFLDNVFVDEGPGASGCTIGTATATVNISDGTPTAQPSLSISVSPSSVNEPSSNFTPITFTITKTGTGACSCNWTTSGTADVNDFGTAAGYTGSFGTGTISFLSTDTSKILNYALIDDKVVEATPQTLTITLSSPTGCTISTSAATVTIADVVAPLYTPPVVEFVRSTSRTAVEYDATNGYGQSKFTVNISGDRSKTSSFTLIVASWHPYINGLGVLDKNDFAGLASIPGIIYNADGTFQFNYTYPADKSSVDFIFTYAVNGEPGMVDEMFAFVMTAPINCSFRTDNTEYTTQNAVIRQQSNAIYCMAQLWQGTVSGTAKYGTNIWERVLHNSWLTYYSGTYNDYNRFLGCSILVNWGNLTDYVRQNGTNVTGWKIQIYCTSYASIFRVIGGFDIAHSFDRMNMVTTTLKDARTAEITVGDFSLTPDGFNLVFPEIIFMPIPTILGPLGANPVEIDNGVWFQIKLFDPSGTLVNSSLGFQVMGNLDTTSDPGGGG